VPEIKEKTMKQAIIAITLTVIISTFTFAQADNDTTRIAIGTNSSDIKMQSQYGSDNRDTLSLLYFEDIGMSKMIFTGKDLVNKDYEITIKQYVNGKLEKREVVFDSKESEYFKIKGEKLEFRIISKITAEHNAKFMFLFNGFSTLKEYKVGDTFKGFAQKDFLGAAKETAIPVNTNTYILTYMMPYVKKDGSSSYCEVAQSSINPEEFGIKYAIPTYFLIDIKFV
jgi:hypothetical protein